VTKGEAFFDGSFVYEPIVKFRRDEELLYVARVGMAASQRFMILTPAGEPAWPHEPLGSLSDVGWALQAHGWHAVTPEPVGLNVRPARTLGRLLTARS
jgi:hypothetical protein